MKKILVLSGGGSRGSFEMGIVSKLISEGKGGWDLITGVSAGSLNTSYLSTIDKNNEMQNIQEFKRLWSDLKNKDVFQSEYFINGLSMYNSDKFKQKIVEIYKDKKPIRPIMISATSLSKGQSVIFDNDDILNYGFVDVIMSSSTIPILFQPYSFLDDMFIDGGFTSNVLLYEAVNYCFKNYSSEEVQIDIIVCGKKLDPETINKDNISFKILLNRIKDIITQQVEYFELLKNIKFPCKIKATVYEEKHDSPISFLNFDCGEKLFDDGFNFTNVETYEIIL